MASDVRLRPTDWNGMQKGNTSNVAQGEDTGCYQYLSQPHHAGTSPVVGSAVGGECTTFRRWPMSRVGSQTRGARATSLDRDDTTARQNVHMLEMQLTGFTLHPSQLLVPRAVFRLSRG